MNTRAVWQLAPKNGDTWLHIDASHILFHFASGKTHFLNETSYFLLEQLGKKQASASELTHLSAEKSGEDVTEEMVRRIEEHLYRLNQLGLIEKERDNCSTPCKLLNST